MDHQYEHGWQRYGFDNQPFEEAAIHGSSSSISVYLSINRGLGRPHISFATIPPDTPGEAIGMHMHRDEPSGKDSEEWYIIIDGVGEMTFSNGDVVRCQQGDLVAIYPGTGHSFRAIGGPCRLISITPEMFTYPHEPFRTDEYPEEFDPRIRIGDVDSEMCPLDATCSVCGAKWRRPDEDKGAATLPVWAREHKHQEETSA